MLSLHTNNADLFTQLFFFRTDRRRKTSEQAASANTHNDGIDLRHLFQDFQTDRSLTRDNIFIIEGMHKHRAGLFGIAFCFSQRLVYGRTVQFDLGTVVAGCGHLRKGCT